jgi:hypothetical protein
VEVLAPKETAQWQKYQHRFNEENVKKERQSEMEMAFQ